MEGILNGKRALVTGGSHGIGKAIAETLVQNGSHVIICARNGENLEKAVRDYGPEKCWIRVVDATDTKQITKLFHSLSGPHERLDILVNNVGGAEQFGDFFSLTDEDWLNAFNLNLMSMVRFTRLAVPFLARSSSPRIINISSLVARQPGKFNPHYGVAKAGMVYLNKYLSNSLASRGILVNTICPGTLKGGGWEKNVADRAKRENCTPEEAEAIMEAEEKKKVPLDRMGVCKDVAELVVFLASDKANFITGQCIDVDGGTRRSIF